MTLPFALVDDPLFVAHVAPEPHPERPERLEAARGALEHVRGPIVRLEPRDVRDDEVLRVHRPGHLDALARAEGRRGYFDADTYFVPGSVAAARRAAGGAVALVEALLGGTARAGLALLRPPGHHAIPETAMGFCLLNNVAIAAAHALAGGAERVLVLDWDVHHGNGTQAIFWEDPGVLFVSLHQWPFYPGTGGASETGEGAGAGFTVNVPLSAGANGAVYASAFDALVCPIVRQFDPDLVLISAGFDAHRRDPLASMALDDQSYGDLTARLLAALPRDSSGRVGIVLEGGYDLAGLRGGLGATLAALSDVEAPGRAPEIGGVHRAEIVRAITATHPRWALASRPT